MKKIEKKVSPAQRVLWRGAISFGLVHIPVVLQSATRSHAIDFDWLDRNTFDPVGYKRINKRTGKEMRAQDIVKGVKQKNGDYVVLSAEDIDAAYPKTTHTIEIEGFVDAAAVPFIFLERPYYIAPSDKAEKVYGLLHQVLIKTGKVGLAKVVIQARQHLAMLAPSGPVMVLDLIRWADEVRLPDSATSAVRPSARELTMAQQLVDDMSIDWNPDAFSDSFRDQILELIAKKAKAGKTRSIAPIEASEPAVADNVFDLTEMLKQSLNGKHSRSAGKKPVARKTVKQATGPASKKTVATGPGKGKTSARTSAVRRKAA